MRCVAVFTKKLNITIKTSYQNSCQLNPYITKDKIMCKISLILINIHNPWKHNIYKMYFIL